MLLKSICAICSTYALSARNTSLPSRSFAMYWNLRFLNASSSAASSLSIQHALYRLNGSQGAPEKLKKMADILLRRYNLRLLNLKEIKGDLKKELIGKFFSIYNECFKAVHNFIPLTPKEIEKTGNAYFSLLKPELTCMVVDENNDIAAFGLCFPSLSEALKKANGSLFPFGWYHALKAKNNFEILDLMINGAAPKWQNTGISAVFHCIMSEQARKAGIKWAVANPQIETNTAVNVWARYEHELWMRRRCWIKKIK